MIDFLKEAQEISGELSEIRKTIHRHPELGNQEFKTSALVEAYLNKLGIETRRILGTAIIGTLKGGMDGPVAALRADMDALPVQEATGCSFASEVPGVMHACGHDVHTTALLGAAKILSSHRQELRGEVRFFFQPDEEERGGARRMIAEGCMEGVQTVFGAHVDPLIPAGSVGIRYGKFYAASDIYDVTVHGKSAHGATRELGIDALGAATEMVQKLLKLPEQFLPDRSVVTVGVLHSGTARNILADEAVFSGILRTLGPDNRKAMKKALIRTIEETSEAWGTRTEIEISPSYGGIVNTDPETALAEKTARNLLGDECVRLITEPKMISEDFGYFVDEAAGCFYHIGAGSSYPLHSDHFLPAEEAVPVGAALHAAVVWNYLIQKHE